jgi:hypothetical protein
MHAIELADLAATFVRYIPAQVAVRCQPHRNATQAYWLTSRYRHENWIARLSQHRDAIQRPGTSFRARQWHDVLPVIQEVLLSEVLTRCLAYHANMLDEVNIDHDFCGLADSSLAAHIEARNRCLHLIVFGQGLSVEHAVQLNRLRRLMENFTDQLLSMMAPLKNCGVFCFESDSVLAAQQQGRNTDRNFSWVAAQTTLLARDLEVAFRNGVDGRSANPRQNQHISRSVLQLMPSDFFDSLGVPHPTGRGQRTAESQESDGRRDDLAEPWLHPLNVLTTTTDPRKKLLESFRRLDLP